MTFHCPLAAPGRHFLIYLADSINAVGDLSSDTARTLWEGLFTEAANQDCNLLVVVGGGYKPSLDSLVYDLITPESADGFISWIIEGDTRADKYFTRFGPNDILVSLSRRYGDHPVVAVANKAGVRVLTQHLVLRHGCRTIGFICGPEHHPYAKERADAYRETLIELGIEPDQRWITPPRPWDWQTGVDGIRHLLDTQKLVVGRDLDAVMCASDRIAMGAFDELRRRKIRVPEDLALTGFNNLLEAQSHIPSLTTVAVPFQRKSSMAVRMVLAEIRGESCVQDPDYLDPLVIMGESCGCSNQRLRELKLPAGVVVGEMQIFSAEEIEHFGAEIEVHFRAFRTSPIAHRQSGSQLVRAFVSAIEQANPDDFIAMLLGQIEAGHYAYMDQLRWQDVLTVFRKMLCLHPFSPASMAMAEALLDRTRLAVIDGFSRRQTDHRLRELREASLLRQLGSSLGFSSDVSTIMDVLAHEIPRLGIPSCWLSIFDDSGDLEAMRAPAYSRLLLALEDGVRSPLPKEGLRFASRQLVPEGLLLQQQRRTFVLFPLAHGEDEYGFVIFEQGPEDGVVYETLAFNIGSALKSALLREELEKRTLALELSIFDLGRARNKLVETEKLAALGELVAGIAHEINTPVGIGVTAVSTMAESVRRLREALESRSARAIREEVETLEEGTDIALRNLYRANQLIESFKQIAVDQSYEERRTFELGAYLHDIVRSLAPRLRPNRHKVKIHCPEPIELTSYPGAFSQIMSNLILNSIIHGFEERQHGQISISCSRVDDHVEIDYRDNGAGMPPAVREKIFLPFFTTKRGQGGTGLGMNIVYNLTTQRLQGSIECESILNDGVRFLIKTPLVV